MGDRPNILLLFPDQHRGDWLGFLGGLPLRTPHIDGLAARGTAFTNALCPSPLCAPSRACLATGLEYDRSPVKGNEHDLPLDAPNLYRSLRTAGYHVATCGKLDLAKGSMDWGLDGRHGEGDTAKLARLGFTGGQDSAGKHDGIIAWRRGLPEPYFAYLRAHGLAERHVADYARRTSPSVEVLLGGRQGPVHHRDIGGNYRNTAPTPLPDHAYIDSWIGAVGRDIVRSAPADRPWFLQVNFNGPHEPVDVTGGMHAAWRDVALPPPSVLGGLTAAEHLEIRRNYAAMIERIDAEVGRFLELLAETGQLERTIVVYASDHGEMLGDGGFWEKFIPARASVHVPLVVAGPGVTRGARCRAPVSLIDLTATLLEIAGKPGMPGADGRSLLAQLAQASRPHRGVALSGLGSWRLAFDGRYKLDLGFEPEVDRKTMLATPAPDPRTAPARLFDLEVDPQETEDVAARHPEIVARLRAAIVAGGATA